MSVPSYGIYYYVRALIKTLWQNEPLVNYPLIFSVCGGGAYVTRVPQLS